MALGREPEGARLESHLAHGRQGLGFAGFVHCKGRTWGSFKACPLEPDTPRRKRGDAASEKISCVASLPVGGGDGDGPSLPFTSTTTHLTTAVRKIVFAAHIMKKKRKDRENLSEMDHAFLLGSPCFTCVTVLHACKKALQTLKGTISLIEMSKTLLSGHTYEELKEEELKALDLDHFDHGVVRIQPEGWLYPGTAPIYLDRLYNMEFRSDDVIVKTFPKCGTTWMQEIVWTMLHNPNLDNPKADEFLWVRSEDISLDMMFDVETLKGQPPNYYLKKFNETCPGKKWEEGLSLQLAEVAKSPRVFKSHFPLSLYPGDILDRIKVVYVTRNPKDMIVSYSYFFEALKVFPVVSSMEETQKKLMTGQILYGPYWSHVKQAWQKRHHPNLHFVFYEDMKADIMSELRKLNEFLGTQLSEEKLEAIAQYTSFSSMKARGEPLQDDVFHKENKSDVTFFRKGKTGDWKNHFTPELQKKMDHWIKENIADTDLNLKWALAE